MILRKLSLRLTLVEQKLNLDFYELSTKGGNSIFSAFQSTLNDEGASTVEYQQGFNTIATVFHFKDLSMDCGIITEIQNDPYIHY